MSVTLTEEHDLLAPASRARRESPTLVPLGPLCLCFFTPISRLGHVRCLPHRLASTLDASNNQRLLARQAPRRGMTIQALIQEKFTARIDWVSCKVTGQSLRADHTKKPVTARRAQAHKSRDTATKEVPTW
jgi:hypothetical protein